MRDEAAGVEEDRDAVVANALRGRIERLRADVDEAVEGFGEARAGGASVIRTERVAEDLEPRAVVLFDHAGQEVRQRMRTEVGPEIRDAQLAVDGRRPRRRSGVADPDFAGDPFARRVEQLGRRVGEGEQIVRRDRRRIRPPERRALRFEEPFEIPPIANLLPDVLWLEALLAVGFPWLSRDRK